MMPPTIAYPRAKKFIDTVVLKSPSISSTPFLSGDDDFNRISWTNIGGSGKTPSPIIKTVDFGFEFRDTLFLGF